MQHNAADWDAATKAFQRLLEQSQKDLSDRTVGDGEADIKAVQKVLKRRFVVKTECGFQAVAVAPDGTAIFTAGCDHLLRVWETTTGVSLKSYQGGKDNFIDLWSAIEEIKYDRFLRGHEEEVTSLSFSPKGVMLASGSADHTVRMWNVRMGICVKVMRGHGRVVLGVAFSPDEEFIVSGACDGTVRVWNTWTGECQRNVRAHTEGVFALALSGDGSTIVTGSSEALVRTWNAKTLECQTTMAHDRSISAVDISRDGATVVSASYDNTVRVWDAKTGECKKTLRGHTDAVLAVALFPDCSKVVSGARNGFMRVWDMATGEAVII